jgi:hypothetical protein
LHDIKKFVDVGWEILGVYRENISWYIRAMPIEIESDVSNILPVALRGHSLVGKDCCCETIRYVQGLWRRYF